MASPMALSLLSLALLALWARGTGAAAGTRCEKVAVDGTYSDRYDNVDVDAILNSGRLLKAYVDCMMERGPCTKDGCFLKEIVPDVLQSECSKCNSKQKAIGGKIMSHLLQKHRNDYWKELLGKYDPDGIFLKTHEFVEDDEEDPDEANDRVA